MITPRQELQRKDEEIAELRQRLSSATASAKHLISRLERELVIAKSKQSSAEVGVRTAEAALSRRYQELTILSNLLRQQEEENAKVLEHLQWLLRLREAISNQPQWWGILPRPWRRRREWKRLQDIGIFDGRAYMARYPDVAEVGVDPLDHYLRHGLAEGRSRQSAFE